LSFGRFSPFSIYFVSYKNKTTLKLAYMKRIIFVVIPNSVLKIKKQFLKIIIKKYESKKYGKKKYMATM
jgi:hypothetical protein